MERPQKITLRSLATDLGVAPATVMRALSNQKNVSSEMRRHIITYAGKMGYKLPGKQQNSVAVIISDFHVNGYIGLILPHLARRLEMAGYRPEVLTRETLDRLKEFSFAGGISLELLPGLEKYWAREYAIPMVALNMLSNRMGGIYSVISDEHSLTGKALDYLYSLGHRKIAVLLVEAQDNPIMRERWEISEHFLARKGIRELSYVGHVSPTFTVPQLVETAIEQGVTAIFGASEYMGAEILGSLFQLNVRVPQDCSVIGFEWEKLSPYFAPPLTTVAQDFATLAKNAVDLLNCHISGNYEALRNIRVSGKLIERQSCTRRG